MQLLIIILTFFSLWLVQRYGRTASSEVHWDSLIHNLKVDRRKVWNWFHWKKWMAPLRLIMTFIIICFVPSFVFFWLVYCILKYGIKYLFLMLRVFLGGYLVPLNIWPISLIGQILVIVIFSVEYVYLLIFFRLIPSIRKKIYLWVGRFFSPSYWVTSFMSKLTKIIIYLIDFIEYIYFKMCKIQHWSVNYLIPQIIYTWTETRPAYRRKIKRKIKWVRKYIKVLIKKFFDKCLWLFIQFLLLFMPLVRCIFYIKFWLSIPNKGQLIYNIIKRSIRLINFNIKFYCKIFILNIKISYYITKYYIVYYSYLILDYIMICSFAIEIFYADCLLWRESIMNIVDKLVNFINCDFQVYKSYLRKDTFYTQVYLKWRDKYLLNNKYLTRKENLIREEIALLLKKDNPSDITLNSNSKFNNTKLIVLNFFKSAFHKFNTTIDLVLNFFESVFHKFNIVRAGVNYKENAYLVKLEYNEPIYRKNEIWVFLWNRYVLHYWSNLRHAWYLINAILFGRDFLITIELEVGSFKFYYWYIGNKIVIFFDKFFLGCTRIILRDPLHDDIVKREFAARHWAYHLMGPKKGITIAQVLEEDKVWWRSTFTPKNVWYEYPKPKRTILLKHILFDFISHILTCHVYYESADSKYLFQISKIELAYEIIIIYNWYIGYWINLVDYFKDALKAAYVIPVKHRFWNSGNKIKLLLYGNPALYKSRFTTIRKMSLYANDKGCLPKGIKIHERSCLDLPRHRALWNSARCLIINKYRNFSWRYIMGGYGINNK